MGLYCRVKISVVSHSVVSHCLQAGGVQSDAKVDRWQGGQEGQSAFSIP